ncbi:hypothetical protein [Streptomyces sp. NPDC056227]|uniref:hypothetical protein n=1 Tax=Streptomyces sp. NPDC056227 TaxID=3345753 RepID=UPI0035D720FF
MSSQKFETWHAKYALRAGIEGTVSQALDVTGIRRVRYWLRPLPRAAFVCRFERQLRILRGVFVHEKQQR